MYLHLSEACVHIVQETTTLDRFIVFHTPLYSRPYFLVIIIILVLMGILYGTSFVFRRLSCNFYRCFFLQDQRDFRSWSVGELVPVKSVFVIVCSFSPLFPYFFISYCWVLKISVKWSRYRMDSNRIDLSSHPISKRRGNNIYALSRETNYFLA